MGGADDDGDDSAGDGGGCVVGLTKLETKLQIILYSY